MTPDKPIRFVSMKLMHYVIAVMLAMSFALPQAGVSPASAQAETVNNALLDENAPTRQDEPEIGMGSESTTGLTTRVSVSSTGAQGNQNSVYPSISADGRYVAFESESTNLVINDINNKTDVFVHDRNSGETTLVSLSSTGAQGNGNSFNPSISADGRYVAFSSTATNLTMGDTNNNADIFIRDRVNNLTSRVSISNTGAQSNGYSFEAKISANGQVVVFMSNASNLIIGDNNEQEDIFVRDLLTQTTEIISVSSSGNQGDAGAWYPSVNSDGRYVVFYFFGSTLVTGRTVGVYLRDRQTKITTFIENGGFPTISADGRYVAFGSESSTIVIGDTNDYDDVFLLDRQVGEITRISVSSTGLQANGGSSDPFISPDGKYIIFSSVASNLVNGDTNGKRDIFLHDNQTGETALISVSSTNTQANDLSGGDSTSYSISADGRFITFESYASNLVTGDTNYSWDIFIRDRVAVTPWLIMFYFASDNDLDYSKYVQNLRNIDYGSDFEVAVFYDGAGDDDSRYYYLSDSGETVLEKGELNSGSPATLVDFATWALNQGESTYSALVMDDHGSQVAISWDFRSQRANIDLAEFEDAFNQITTNGRKVNVVFASVCLMGTIEAGYELRDYVDYYVASEHLSYVHDTTRFLDTVTEAITPKELAIKMATDYHNIRVNKAHTIAAVNLAKTEDLVNKISLFSTLLINNMVSLTDELRDDIVVNVQRFPTNGDGVIDSDDEAIDLYDFARLINENTTNQEVKNAASQVMSAIESDQDKYIMYEEHDSDSTYKLDKSHGVSIFFSRPNRRRSIYSGAISNFAAGTDWGVLGPETYQTDVDTYIQWGPMLVAYTDLLYPDAIDDPNPPPPQEEVFTPSRINSMSKTHMLTGSPDFILTINGQDFLDGDQVNWNGTPHPTTFVNSTQLQAEIYADDLDNVNVAEITVVHPGYEGYPSNALMFTIHSFDDVMSTHPLWRYVEGFFAREITTGCAVNPLRYCPDRAVTRGEMAVFLLRSMHVDDIEPYAPADDPADPFADVPTPGKNWMEPWIEQFYATGITTGCAVGPMRYCPERNVTRGEMAVFVLRALHKDELPYTPSPGSEVVGIFADVPASNWMKPWIEEFYELGITTGCGVSGDQLLYCPGRNVNRAEMATFVDRAFGFPPLP